ncbi:OmpA family protein [Paramagnetospirillum magneticum]|uniref:Outer membrane protein and related peptidoglycan-associated lipo protein n=1 Tax=Paramagnetospirillum magneticum (strain ATCC 700264 / AMB-1) TaxID=342108 RepID=Q2W2X8_PARM1|nr:OmpA family protein [Paramagnetospirillum magneticum]BAE51797.1 Outer membrane protein and related peptidoglycan-associated lipo protein [Paramagnetospirillum magneticum AMB-1]
MTDSRRDFLLRFAAAALAAGGTGCESPVETADEPLTRRETPLAVYGPPPARPRTELREMEILFAAGRLDLDAKARQILDDVAGILAREASIPVIIEGHADDTGTREYNLAIGERRAETVRQYLIGRGVDGERIRAISFGKERPRAPGRTKAARAANRRVVVRLEPGA